MIVFSPQVRYGWVYFQDSSIKPYFLCVVPTQWFDAGDVFLKYLLWNLDGEAKFTVQERVMDRVGENRERWSETISLWEVDAKPRWSVWDRICFQGWRVDSAHGQSFASEGIRGKKQSGQPKAGCPVLPKLGDIQTLMPDQIRSRE